MQNIRNIAIIAHVDHGKTTLVDRILYQSHLFRENQQVQDLVLDNNDLERERGITILSKNVSVRYKGVKINVIDTPGHSDFGGEVERVLNMADGVLLVVDAFEGPMPQTRFVTQKAIELGLKPIVVINKVDKPNCHPDLAQEAVFELMFNLGATDEQLDFPTVYGSAKNGWMGPDWNNPTSDISYLLDTIIEQIPAPKIQWGQTVSLVKRDGTVQTSKIKELYVFEGLGKEKYKNPVEAGEICALLGLDDFEIGDTVADAENPEQLPPIKVDEPTMSMLFTINNSPFFGKEGKYVTSRHLRDRLFAELEKNLALRIEETDSPDRLNVFGRGILHLSILIETMRREGYELQVGQPQVIIKEIDGQKCEPVEQLTVLVPEEMSSRVIDYVSRRKGDLLSMDVVNDRVHLNFTIPSRGLIGLTNQLLTATEGEAIISHRFIEFQPWKGEIAGRHAGSLIAMETGQAYAYSLNKLQDRGRFFIEPNDPVYAGQVIGEHIRQSDLVINVCKSKKLSNMRAAGSDEKLILAPAVKYSLEQYMEFIAKDEYLEITPQSLRVRKIILDETERKRAEKRNTDN